jgi:Phage integrase family
MARLRAPAVREKPVPFFTSVELSRLEKACRGNTFAQRRDAGIVSVFRAAGIRLAALAGIRYDPDDPGRSDVDLDRREIYVRGKGGKDRTVRIDHEAARRLDRYLRARAGHKQSHRLELWLGTGGRGPLTGNGIYQMVRRRGDRAGVRVYPHRFRHHFSHTWQMGGIASDATPPICRFDPHACRSICGVTCRARPARAAAAATRSPTAPGRIGAPAGSRPTGPVSATGTASTPISPALTGSAGWRNRDARPARIADSSSAAPAACARRSKQR